MNKPLISLFAASAAFAYASLAFSQTNSSAVTRSGVVAQIVQLKDVGYKAESDHNSYPRNIQAAEARVSGQIAGSSYGVPGGETVVSGSRENRIQSGDVRSIYARH